MIRRPPKSTLFPNPTFFRSRKHSRAPSRGRNRILLESRAIDLQSPTSRSRWEGSSRVATNFPRQATSRSPKRREQTCSPRSEEHTSELQSHSDLVCRLLLEK